MYEAHKWKIGEEITSDKLNHIEKGIEEAGLPREITDPQDGQTLKYDAASGKWVNGEGGSGGSSTLVVTATGNADGLTMDHTWQEIHDAFPNVEFLEVSLETIRGFITSVNTSDRYTVNTVTFGGMGTSSKTYSADSATGYPAASGGSPSIG